MKFNKYSLRNYLFDYTSRRLSSGILNSRFHKANLIERSMEAKFDRVSTAENTLKNLILSSKEEPLYKYDTEIYTGPLDKDVYGIYTMVKEYNSDSVCERCGKALTHFNRSNVFCMCKKCILLERKRISYRKLKQTMNSNRVRSVRFVGEIEAL